MKHICILDRGDINIKYQLYCGETFEDLSDDFCDGYLLYDNRSCYKITNGNGVLLNITSHKLKYDGKEYQTFIPFSINNLQICWVLSLFIVNVSSSITTSFTSGNSFTIYSNSLIFGTMDWVFTV